MPDPTVSHFRNACRLSSAPQAIRQSLPIPSNLAFHDLTANKIAPPEFKAVFGMGDKFIRTPEYTTGDLSNNHERFKRDFNIKVLFAGKEQKDSETKLYVKSLWEPLDFEIPPWVHRRLGNFQRRVSALFKKKKAQSNFLPFQEKIMQELMDYPSLMFPNTDKGLGPCAVEYDQYVTDCLKHLQDEKVYKQLSEEEATVAIQKLSDQIFDWLDKYEEILPPQAYKFILHHLKENFPSPYGQFYILYKIHKGKKDDGSWPTRPVCSDVSSLPHGLGKWITEMLLPIAQAQKSFFQDSFELKDLLETITVPSNGLLFTSDATSMYTNILTEPALQTISAYLRSMEDKLFHHYDADALIDALEIVFRNNYFKLGDTYWKQQSGTGMGISPAPPWATIFYALHEETILAKWSKHLVFYKRFIDDVIGIWLVHPDPIINEKLWTEFQSDMNQWHGLEWTCTEPALSCDFMDLTISISGTKLHTTLFEKAQNLYLYLPPHSAHSKGVLTGLVFGQVLRVRRLCSFRTDADNKLDQFKHRLMERGHSQENLTSLFAKAEENASQYIARSKAERAARKAESKEASSRQIYFHLQFHPQDPPSKELQRLWKECISEPPGEDPLSKMCNYDGEPVGIDRLIVAYSRPPNLRNQFSVRNIHGRGRPVSEYLVG